MSPTLPKAGPTSVPEALAAHGALLIDKPAGISSFGVIERLQRAMLSAYGESHGLRKRDLPKLGHGGTLDPFATGLLAVCVGDGVKLARYFLGSRKTYEGTIRFGETTASGDLTNEITARTEQLPESLAALRKAAHGFTLQPYLQTPPMHSAKKKDGKPLYELARQGIEIERTAKELALYSYEILDYTPPCAEFRVSCSSGTYVRTLSQDLAVRLGSLGMLDRLRRTGFGVHSLESALTLDAIVEATLARQPWSELPAWVPFDDLMRGYDRVDASRDEALALIQGKQGVLPGLMARLPSNRADAPDLAAPTHAVIYHGPALVAVACRSDLGWGLERVLTVAI